MFTVKSSASSWCDELGSPSYPKTLSWNETTDSNCCLWDGVTCDVSTGHVTGLDLSCSKLYGTIHPNTTLFQLSHLQQLNLAFNHFNYSPFPPSFGRFTNLSHLNLSSSFLSGSIPSEIAHLSNLVSLDLSSSSTGTLRLEPHNFKTLLMNLTRLENLNLTEVNISSGLPDSLLNLSSLATLDLYGTSLNGKLLDSIGYLGFLNYLDLSFNKFSGPLPESLGNLTRITLLRLSGNDLNGQFPSTLSNLEQLTEFSVVDNNLDGNSGLCGLPLSKKCRDNVARPQPPQPISQDDDDDASGFTWRIVLMGYGCGFVVGATIGFAMFLTGRPKWYTRIVGGDPHRKVVRINQIGWRRSLQS